MPIPKIIHYCWVGPNSIPERELECIRSWKKHLPGHVLMFWNEETFDISSNIFSKQAYEARYYAFVSDYIRTKVLYEYGGIYLDTDVEILDSLDKILEKGNSFLGFESRSKIGTAVMGFTPKHYLMGEFMNYYIDNDFQDAKGNVNTIANVSIFSEMLTDYGLVLDGKASKIRDIDIYPREYFYPKKLSDDTFRISEQTVAVHKYSSSWLSDNEKKRGNSRVWRKLIRPQLRFFKTIGVKLIGRKATQKIEIKIRNILK
ncbi:glycosyltransferase [Gammaproteobacteria bacterium]|nr:glycosyltransferase [Gammaproteobacteria bacterium]